MSAQADIETVRQSLDYAPNNQAATAAATMARILMLANISAAASHDRFAR